MNKLLNAYPLTKAATAKLNAKRHQAHDELQKIKERGETDAAAQFKEAHEKELRTETVENRNQIVKELLHRVDAAANRHRLDLVFDSSAQNLTGLNVVLHHSNSLDLTEEILHEFHP